MYRGLKKSLRGPSAKSASQRSSGIERLESRVLFTTLPTGFGESTIASGLSGPTSMDVLPDGRVLITTQGGDLRVVQNGTLLATPFIHLAVDGAGERGLLGVAHDPNFATNHFIYLYHTVPGSGSTAAFNEVSRFTADGNTAAAGSQVDLLRLNNLSSATNHNGGAVYFGADGMLYVNVGENANPSNAQTLSNLLGKVLRIDVSTSTAGDPVNDVAKLVPTDNPFVGIASGINQAIYALGLRNPFSAAVDPASGTIYVNDVGQNTWEEIDQLQAGANYGWGLTEGFASNASPSGLGPGVYRDPLLSYNHGNATPTTVVGDAIVGGLFYEPPAGVAQGFPSSFAHSYFYSDLTGNFIRVFNPATPGALTHPDPSTSFATGIASSPVNLKEAPDGGIYYLSRGSGNETGVLREIRFTAAPVTAAVSGQIFLDKNRNGRRDFGDGGLAGQQAWVDLNNNGKLDASEPTATTDTDGNYSFGGLAAGRYHVRVVKASGFLQTAPAHNAARSVRFAAAPITGVDFGLAATLAVGSATVRGSVFNDVNGNGKRAGREALLPNQHVWLDTNANGVQDAGEPDATTDRTGKFVIFGVAPGTYALHYDAPAGFHQTTNSGAALVLQLRRKQVATVAAIGVAPG